LPVETRLKDATVREFRDYADERVTFRSTCPTRQDEQALARVSEVKQVPVRSRGAYRG
jgi:hypothetical protein